ncbi:MAG: hypothetical protein ACJAVV_001098 [Alphaproteobacteria bacterium]|jgi:hypothetical protein
MHNNETDNSSYKSLSEAPNKHRHVATQDASNSSPGELAHQSEPIHVNAPSAIAHEEQADIQQITAEQDFNESLIKLLVLLYQIDGKVTLTEQDLFDDITVSLNWRSGVSISAFINDAIHQARVAIDQRESREFLFKLGAGLNHDPAQALEYAMDITAIDGKRSEEEVELLALLSNRVLARGLVE